MGITAIGGAIIGMMPPTGAAIGCIMAIIMVPITIKHGQ
jgi:hypothetical protein